LAKEAEAQAAAMEWTSASAYNIPSPQQNSSMSSKRERSSKTSQSFQNRGPLNPNFPTEFPVNMVFFILDASKEYKFKQMKFSDYPTTSTHHSVHCSFAC